MSSGSENKFNMQAGQYSFPYHYIPQITEDGTGTRFRSLAWGLEYLCYQNHVLRTVMDLGATSALEVGCGDGHLINNLSSIPKRLGVDLEPKAIELARALGKDAKFQCMDARQLDEQFDVVMAVEVLEHIPDDDVPGFLQTLVDRTRPGGHVIITVPTTVLPLNPKHFRHYDEAILSEQLHPQLSRLKDIKMSRVYREPWWLSFYLKATLNRFWIWEIAPMRRLIWRAVLRHCELAGTRDGRHLVLVASRSEKS